MRVLDLNDRESRRVFEEEKAIELGPGDRSIRPILDPLGRDVMQTMYATKASMNATLILNSPLLRGCARMEEREWGMAPESRPRDVVQGLVAHWNVQATRAAVCR